MGSPAGPCVPACRLKGHSRASAKPFPAEQNESTASSDTPAATPCVSRIVTEPAPPQVPGLPKYSPIVLDQSPVLSCQVKPPSEVNIAFRVWLGPRLPPVLAVKRRSESAGHIQAAESGLETKNRFVQVTPPSMEC